ncbi:aminoglycoside phosphotransferase (APT) family kinase protein [Kribbella orskensis]|uniref:Aminoglycoside phosphotransferase (APT) family kinase protein n=1 Tax=Kribbella orskensis TaxID=2512216 RepID=A0ABY2BS04_9ACTN|nr:MULTISPECIES: phosphotransferase [Kribbella]TCN43257.1 aminoglycoside phosphotransferase (APT) family kinase protein [Kribbella sp. VKM Ac-2500]TCO29387.1 aminoglycoside phosphotransferase (APT) family kinase protein [Kribbella orskensis]
MDDFEALAASAVPLTGGYGGETYAVSAAGEDAVLRLYARHPERAAVDVSLLRLGRGLLPVPRVLDAMPDPAGDGAPPYVLTERLPGVNLQTYLDTAGDKERQKVGEQLGELLVRLSGMPFLTFGEFVGRDLVIESFGAGGLTQWLDRYVEDLGLTRDQVESLYSVLDRAEDLADTGVDRICLVHSDFNPKNLLVDPDSADITGLVDWEFAHAGSPYTDLGNLLRFCADPVLGRAVLSVVRETGPDLGDRLEERGRGADLWALIDLAARRPANPVAIAAHALITRIADTGDLAGGRPDLDAVH